MCHFESTNRIKSKPTFPNQIRKIIKKDLLRWWQSPFNLDVESFEEHSIEILKQDFSDFSRNQVDKSVFSSLADLDNLRSFHKLSEQGEQLAASRDQVNIPDEESLIHTSCLWIDLTLRIRPNHTKIPPPFANSSGSSQLLHLQSILVAVEINKYKTSVFRALRQIDLVTCKDRFDFWEHVTKFALDFLMIDFLWNVPDKQTALVKRKVDFEGFERLRYEMLHDLFCPQSRTQIKKTYVTVTTTRFVEIQHETNLVNLTEALECLDDGFLLI